jgi:hypothetical protein
MGDYAQDQLDELEALESIYSEEITILGDSPHRSSTAGVLNVLSLLPMHTEQ